MKKGLVLWFLLMVATGAAFAQAPTTPCTSSNVNASYSDNVNNVPYLCVQNGSSYFWKANIGIGAPTVGCSAVNYGASYTDLSGNAAYTCGGPIATPAWFTGGTGGPFVPLSGGTMTGALTAPSVGPVIYADQKCSTPGTRDISCLTNAIAAAQAAGSPVVLTCGQTYPYAGNFPSGTSIDAACPGNVGANVGHYPTTISYSGLATIGPANGLSLRWVNIQVSGSNHITLTGIQHSTLDMSASCGTGLSVTTTGTVSNGSTSLTVASGTGIAAGQQITMAGLVSGTTVLSVSGTTVTLNRAATAAESGVTVTFSSPCLWVTGASLQNTVFNSIPSLLVDTQSGGGVEFQGQSGYTTENVIGQIVVTNEPQASGTAMGVAVDFSGNCDSNVIGKIGIFQNPNVSAGNGVVMNDVTATGDSGADNEIIGLLDSTGSATGNMLHIGNSVGNMVNLGVSNFSVAYDRPDTLNYHMEILETVPSVTGLYWSNLNLNTLYRNGSYASYNVTGGPSLSANYMCNVYDVGDGVGAPQSLTIQDCFALDASGTNSGRWFRRQSSGTNTWLPWIEMSNGYTPSGTAGVTAATCTQWTNGLCTHN